MWGFSTDRNLVSAETDLPSEWDVDMELVLGRVASSVLKLCWSDYSPR